MILATRPPERMVSERAAEPAISAAGAFTISLTGKAPSGGLKVAYFDLN